MTGLTISQLPDDLTMCTINLPTPTAQALAQHGTEMAGVEPIR